MVVIFGFGAGSPEDQGEVAPCICPNCHNDVFLHHVRSKKCPHPPPAPQPRRRPPMSRRRGYRSCKLAQLHDQGVLSDAAYTAAKRRVLEQDKQPRGR